MIRFSSLRTSLVLSYGASSTRSLVRSGTVKTLMSRVAIAPGRRRSLRWLRSRGWHIRAGPCSPRHRPGIRSGCVVRPIWTSGVCAKRDLTQRSTIVPLCLRVTFLLNVARVRYAAPGIIREAHAGRRAVPPGAGTVQAVVLARRAPDNRPPRDDVRGSNDPLLPATGRGSNGPLPPQRLYPHRRQSGAA